MIESIKIRDFRGIKTGKIEGFRKINLLVGLNNSGKSAVLEAIYLACTASRPAGLNISNETFTYPTTVVDRDLLGDHPMQRVWAKHNYGASHEGLSEWDGGRISDSRENKSVLLSGFNLYPDRGFAKGEELVTAVFGLESEDRTDLVDKNRADEIAERPRALTREIDALEEAARSDAESEKQGLEQERTTIQRGQRESQDKIQALADKLMKEGQEGFEKSRLIFCWHQSLTHNYIGDAAWVIKGKIPSAQHTFLYDVSKVTGYLPLDVFQRNFNLRSGLLQRVADSFGEIFRREDDSKEEFTIQFLPAPDNNNLLQGWIAPNDKPPVPIDGYGDGARSVFKLIVALHMLIDSVNDENPGIVFWEEPELFQNPKTLGRLLKEVVRLVEPKPIQIFIATHSIEAPAHFVRLVRRGQLSENDLLVLITRLLHGELLSAGFDDRNVEAWIRMQKDLRVPSGDADSPLTYQLEEFYNESDGD